MLDALKKVFNTSAITLKGIATREEHLGPMQTHEAIHIRVETGVGNDLRGKPGKRQVTVLSEESWQAACDTIEQTPSTLPWTTRRANLLVSGITFGPEDVGSRLILGKAVLEITRETDPCHFMEKAQPGLKHALKPEWRGGVCCRVLQGGEVSLGDSIKIER
ncbi:MOSC domain-containing protein [Marinibactrum halimedae]|uniref:Molybdenum cofactor biosynthesis protein n=1 Tax=Marinibactrum halimedae TaxID=1444977 RepID=A0AA37T962_9GAMM|nr:MOSC domain-containing protein [Marinibactrum halimedae]MCD9457654.1 MOSC domain-containing protein [Marinibactrum halimedae]GLS24972.1 molybdenum cofactor biosynthesis protein [Marinibactrum halimedae]